MSIPQGTVLADDAESIVPNKLYTFVTSCNKNVINTNNMAISLPSLVIHLSSNPLKSKIPISPSFFPFPDEPRIPYLLRFPKLIQIALNSGDFKMLKGLLDQVTTNDCLFLVESIPPIVGKLDIVETFRAFIAVSPDSIVFVSNVKHAKRRIISFKVTTSGTFLFQNPKDTMLGIVDKYFVESMGEDMTSMKLLYNRCKMEKIGMKFKVKSLAVCGVNEELTEIEKIMSKTISLSIHEAD